MLSPTLLWTGAALLYGAWWRRRASTGPLSAGTARSLTGAGLALVCAGFVAAVAEASGWGAGLGAAVAHLTAAGTSLAVLVPLVPRPVWTMALVAGCGLLLGLMEAAS